MGKLVDIMKGETDLDSKLLEITILNNTASVECRKEFIHKGGLAILCQWAKEIRLDPSIPNSVTWEKRRDIFKIMISALDKLDVTWNLIKKTKIGKAINSILKA